MANTTDARRLLEVEIPCKFRVPGCAAAIVKGGKLIAQHTWGYANLEARTEVTPETIFPICSISKQMVCLVLTELISEGGQQFVDKFYDALREILPTKVTSSKDLTIDRLVGMQSGLRDYWALTVLWGATPQDRFSIYNHAREALKRVGGFHFAPGSEMSYCNSNYVAVGLAIEAVTGKTLSDLLQGRVFGPAGMKTAALRPDTAAIPGSLVGYEGGEGTGYIPYANRIEWAADAGIMASLEDMIAYEINVVHRDAKTEGSAYYKNSQPPTYIDGNPAYYGQGLMRGKVEGLEWVGHSGGLAGFRLRRHHVPAAGLSVITLFNSEIDSKAVVDYAIKKMVTKDVAVDTVANEGATDETSNSTTHKATQGKWAGTYFDSESRLAVVIRQDKSGQIEVNYDGHDQTLRLNDKDEKKASSSYMDIEFQNSDDTLSINRLLENRRFTAKRIASVAAAGADVKEYAGKFYSEEVDSTMHVSGSGGMLYAAFDGYLGKGPIHTMRHLGEDVFWMSCFRSLDAPSPGNWTVAFRKEGGEVKGVTVGCMIARGVEYKRV